MRDQEVGSPKLSESSHSDSIISGSCVWVAIGLLLSLCSLPALASLSTCEKDHSRPSFLPPLHPTTEQGFELREAESGWSSLRPGSIMQSTGPALLA